MATSPDHYRPAGAVGIAPAVGTEVRLLRDGRIGRVVAWSQGGLLCRVRLAGGADAGAIIECAGCELVPAPEPDGEAEAVGRETKERVPRDAAGARPPTAILRLVAPAASPAPAAASAAGPGPEREGACSSGGRGRWDLLPLRARR